MDSHARLFQARTRYAQAVGDRDALGPDDPGYRHAVHEVGVAWSHVQYWSRRAAAEHRNAALAQAMTRRSA